MRSGRDRDRRRARGFERPLSDASITDRIEEEIRFHLDSRTDELMAEGHSRVSARRQAEEEFGNPTAARVELRRLNRARLLRHRMLLSATDQWRDLRYIVRTLRRQPGFSAVVIVTLALAIGANAAVFGIIDRLLLRGPEQVRDRAQVAQLYAHIDSPSQGYQTRDIFGYVTYTDLRDHAEDLERVAAYFKSSVTGGSGLEARSLRSGYATWDFFPLLGVRPQLGRFFAPDEDRPPRGLNVVVLDDGHWRRAFGADSAAIGRTIAMGDQEYVIVGVAPPGFTGADLAPVDLWFPMAVRGRTIRTDWATTRHSAWMRIIARLGPGITMAGASEEVASVHTQRAMAEAPDELRSAARLELLPLGRDRAGNEPPETAVARWLVGVAAIVLLIAVANVSSLQLARGVRRRREVAVRLALGIDRWRLVRLFLVESVLLAGAGAVLGLLVAHAGASVIRAVLLPQIAWITPPVNERVFLFSALTALAVGMVVGLVPALVAARTDLSRSLKTGVRAGGGSTNRLRSGLLVVQPGLALLLLIGAGLFVRSLSRVRDIELGFEPNRVLAVEMHWPSVGGQGPEVRRRVQMERDRFAQEARDHFNRLPWVEAASISIGLPFSASYGVRVRPRGIDSLPSFTGEGPDIIAVSHEYFRTVGTNLLRGRLFGPRDVLGAEPVVVVNDAMARAFWPGADALGQCLTLYDDPIPCVRVVGVVQNAKQWSLREAPALKYYVPITQVREIGGPVVLIRPSGDAEGSVERVRAELVGLRPDLPYASIGTIQRWIDPEVRPWRLGAILFSLFGLLALTVAGSGLYSILAYLVEQRRAEFGVRCALGASARRILLETVRRGLIPSLVGLALGASLALALGSWLQPQLYETSARDPLVFGGAAGLLVLVALLGTLVPARRAAKVDPIVALRDD